MPVITGLVVSRTVTMKLPVAVLPAASVAEQLTAVVPKGKVLPEAGEQVTVGLAGFWSMAVAVNVTVAPAALVASTVWLPGRLSVGGVVSQAETVAVTASVAVRVI